MEQAVNLTPALDYVGTNGFVNYTGVHLIIDLWKAENLCSAVEIERIFRQAVEDCEASLLHIYMHEFTGGGITGVAVLSESHISIHTWPEFEYAALDIFLCGTKDPWRAINAIREGFRPASFQISEHKRGILSND